MLASACSWGHTKWTPYEVLRVPPSASISEIRAAFKRMALRTHPDKATVPRTTSATSGDMVTSGPAPPAVFHVVKEASEILLDPYLRAAYDAARSHALVREVGAVSDTYSLAEDFVRVRMAGEEGDEQHVQMYQRECRCGGIYEVALFLGAAGESGSRGGDASACCSHTLRCECDSCSLVVEVVV
ncbi:hypothetical protein LSCM1_06791 [Leishmania martiniquensis]|uniref:J domain-containing protein n=1 Tax=Leishmania martiniquensis TaxID=1580590 RepID=A0A836HBK5_9TRYP|nr:hypothetical protein LSCM1_06791 [Leishmania martiniquensis]